MEKVVGHDWCTSAETKKIKPMSQGFILIKHNCCSDNKTKKNLLFSPTISTLSNVILPKSGYPECTDSDHLFVNVLNCSEETIEIHSGSVLGIMSEVELANEKFEKDIKDYKPLVIEDINRLVRLSKEKERCIPKHYSTLSNNSNKNKISTRDMVDHELKVKLKKLNYGKNLSNDEKLAFIETIQKNEDCFQWNKGSLARCNLVTHRIPTGNADPIAQKQYPIPTAAKEQLTKQVEQMLKDGVIRPSESSWRSPVLLVKQKNSDGTPKFRFCIDLKKINAITAKDCYSLPMISQTTDTLIGSKYFTTLDVDRAFWQIGVEEADKSKLAFVIDGKLYEFEVMPFGSMNAPATFQRLADRILRGLTWKQCLIYIDDVLVFSSSFEQHLKDVDEVLNRFKHAGLKLKPEKCFFGKEEVEYLGFSITRDGIRATRSKIEAVLKVKPPETTKQLFSFLCSMNYYRMLIPRFGEISANLYQMCETKRRLCVWNDEMKNLFEFLKQSLVTAPILAFPDENKPFIIHSDASGTAIASVLLQPYDKILKPVSFASRKLNKTEKKYSTTEREMLSITYSVKQFEHHILGRLVKIGTDHEPLVTMKDLKVKSGRLARMFHEISEQEYILEYIPGDQNYLPDFLSRANSTDSLQTHIHLTELRSEINWEIEQAMDSEIVKVKTLISSNEDGDWSILIDAKRWSRERKKLYIFNNILYNENKIVVPTQLMEMVIKRHHDVPSAGHRGIETTINSISSRFYWNFMPIQVKNYIQSCHKCQTYNYGLEYNRAPLKPIIVTRPWQLVGVDYMGPFKRTNNGNVYIIILIDHFTKFVVGQATITFDAETTAKVLFNEIICKLAMVEMILSDQGVNFEARLFKQLCILIQAEKMRTTAYNPSCNGITERMNKNVKPYLAKFVDQSHDNWDIFLPMAISAYNNSYHSTIRMTPYEALFGRPSVKVSDIILNSQLPGDTKVKDVAEFTLALRKAALNVNRIIEENTRIAQIKQKEQYDKFVRDTRTFKIGDLVKIRNSKHKKDATAAFEPKFIGPYKIVKLLGDLDFYLVSPSLKPETVHYNKLFHYIEREDYFDHSGEKDFRDDARIIDLPIDSHDSFNKSLITDNEIDLDELYEYAFEQKQKKLKIREEILERSRNQRAADILASQIAEENRRAVVNRLMDETIESVVSGNGQLNLQEDILQMVNLIQIPTNLLVGTQLEVELNLNNSQEIIEQMDQIADQIAQDVTETRLNEKGKQTVLCPKCREKWCEITTGLRIHGLSCRGLF